jgi:hypothetical protein
VCVCTFFFSHRLDPISSHHHAIRPLTRKAHLIFQVCIYTKHLEIKYLHIVLNKRKRLVSFMLDFLSDPFEERESEEQKKIQRQKE